MTIETGTGLAGPNPIPITPDLGVAVAVTFEEVTLDPITHPHATAHHATEAQAHIITDKTTWKTKDRKYKQVTIDDPPPSTIALMKKPVTKKMI